MQQIIDSHIHVGDAINMDFPVSLCNTCEDTLALMEKYGVQRAILLPIPHRSIDTQVSNEYVYNAYLKHPDRFVPFCRVDSNLEQNLNNGFRGAKIHMVYEDINLRSIRKQLQILEDFSAPLIIHLRFAQKVKQIKEILRIAPNLNIIVAHMGRGHLYTSEQVIENAIAIKNFCNVYMETSTVGDAKSVINSAEIIGFDRVIFGSDYPFGKNFFGENYDYKFEINKLQKLLSEDEFKSIFHDNILNILSKSDAEAIKIRRVRKDDFEALMKIFTVISDEEKKFLALSQKLSLIKTLIKSEKHCYVAVKNNKIIGFLRESGRPNGFSLLEELVVSPKSRNCGIANKLLRYYHNAFPKNMATVNSANNVMLHLCEKYNYVADNPDAKRITHWKREALS